MAALSSAVQDLARFFLSLAGSSSQGAVLRAAGTSVPVSGVGVQLCPSAPGGGAVASCDATLAASLTARPASASAAVPGSSGRQQREEEASHQSRRRHRSSSGGTGRASKKRPRDRSPSPIRSSCRRETSYRSSDSSEEERAVSPPPTSGLVPGGTPGDLCPALAGDCSPRPGPSGLRRRSSAVADRSRSGFGGHLSPPPPGEAVDDHSSAFDSLDIDQNDSFRSVLALIRNFHDMEEPAGVPSARCKTSLASIYGLMSETSPAFHLPISPLLRSLLDDTNLALSKFLEDQTVHGFLPVSGRRHRRYYCTSSSSFPGPYSVPPGVTSITLALLCASRDGVSLPISLAGLGVVQDVCGSERRSSSTDPSPAQDSSEAFGWRRFGRVVVDWFCSGELLWCFLSCSEAVLSFSFWSVWQEEEEPQGQNAFFLVLWRLRPLRR